MALVQNFPISFKALCAHISCEAGTLYYDWAKLNSHLEGLQLSSVFNLILMGSVNLHLISKKRLSLWPLSWHVLLIGFVSTCSSLENETINNVANQLLPWKEGDATAVKRTLMTCNTTLHHIGQSQRVNSLSSHSRREELLLGPMSSLENNRSLQ